MKQKEYKSKADTISLNKGKVSLDGDGFKGMTKKEKAMCSEFIKDLAKALSE